MTSSCSDRDSKAFLISSIGAAKLEATATFSLSPWAAGGRVSARAASSLYLMTVVKVGLPLYTRLYKR